MANKKSDRGNLLKNYLIKVPAKSFEVAAEFISKYTKGKSGIYALYKDDSLYYVGLAKSLRGRIKHHTKDNHARKWNKFSFFVIRRVKYLKDVETLILQISKPGGNSVKGRLPKQYRLNKAFDKELTRKAKEISSLKKASKPTYLKPKYKRK